MALITPRDIALFLYHDAEAIEEDDEACLYVIQRVDELVLSKTIYGEESAVPAEHLGVVRRISLSLGCRVWSNPELLARKAIGPLSRAWIDGLVTGLVLRPDELEELVALGAEPSPTGGLWALGINTGREHRVGRTLTYVGPGSGNESEGDLWWPYGQETPLWP